MKFRTVLVPVDFSDHSDYLMRVAISFAQDNKSELTIVHVVSTDLYVSSFYSSTINLPSIIVDIISEASSHMDEFLARFDFGGVKYSKEVIEGNVHKAIFSKSESIKADLIMMGTHGRTGLEHIVLGSTAEKVIRHAPCPVLTIKKEPVSL